MYLLSKVNGNNQPIWRSIVENGAAALGAYLTHILYYLSTPKGISENNYEAH